MTYASSYDEDYYAVHEAGTTTSARIVLEHLYQWFRPTSVVDVGCGQGAWLAAAEQLGSTTLVGLDGPWVDDAAMESPTIEFRSTDLEHEVELDGPYDLCLSMEVAEHLSPHRAPLFVRSLCSAADVVLFSAATPHQTGVNHVTLRWPSFWADLFAKHRFSCYDILRPRIWTDTQVDWWYRQNTLLFVRQGAPLAGVLDPEPALPMRDIVHPEHLASNAREYQESIARPNLRFCLSALARWLRVR